jgi:hypothetical protein
MFAESQAKQIHRGLVSVCTPLLKPGGDGIRSSTGERRYR